jgi:phosphatidylserine decarboxylase
MMGRLSDLTGPPELVRRAIDTFVRVYDVDMSDALVPRGGFATFDDFFTRRLAADARPVDPSPDVLIAPADGRLEASGPIDLGATLRIKGRLYDVGELVGDRAAAASFDGGSFAVVYLAPPDYHRVHAPVSGTVTSVCHVEGTLYPVSSVGVDHVPNLFARNERVAVTCRSERHGVVATILVGAIGVGRIGLAFDDLLTNTGQSGGARTFLDGPHLERGDELGVFHLGSTVIVLTGPSPKLALERRPGDRLRMGEPLFCRTTG